MAKSKYPQQLDSSVELPPVRDNILEIGSEAINSLRSAIINIEKTLGINPQGAVGKTLAERISKSLDENGNIKEDALDRSNVLSGPIIDSNVSEKASIKESKLKLNYPTSLLQSQISIVSNDLNALITQINELSTLVSVHLSEDLLNRHKALSISVDAIDSNSSDLAVKNFEATNVQTALESIVNSHINYSGNEISETNNSHLSEQVYFNNENVSTVITSSNLQSAIEEIVSAALSSEESHQDLLHSNGILKSGKMTASDSTYGLKLDDNISISFSKSTGSPTGTTTIIVNDSILLSGFDLKKSDILTISDESDTDLLFSGDYEIESFTLSSDAITTITVFGLMHGNSTSLTVGMITKNIKQQTNFASLLTAARQNSSLTSSNIIQVCNPDAVKVISNGIRPLQITSTNRYISLQINDQDSISIDLYNSLYSRQSIDTIVERINEQVDENNYLFLAYRIDLENSSELVIAYNIPDSDSESYTMTIARGSDDGIDSAGFSEIEDLINTAEFNSYYYLNGKKYSGLFSKINSTQLGFSSGNNLITNLSSGINFISSNVKIGDLVHITSSTSDDGTYVVSDVTDSKITIINNKNIGGFSSASTEDTIIRIFSSSISFENMIFESVNSTFGSAFANIFMDSNRSILKDKIFEYTPPVLTSTSLINIIDYFGIITKELYTLNISKVSGKIYLSLNDGEQLLVTGENSNISLLSGNDNLSIKFNIPDVNDLISYITSTGDDISMDIYPLSTINDDSNLLLSVVNFDNFTGKFSGGFGSSRTFSKVLHGNIGSKDINESLSELIFKSTKELRSNGVIYGLDITNFSLSSDLYMVSVSRGACNINGKRIEISEITSFISDIDSTSYDKVFLAIDSNGQLRIEKCDNSCNCPFELTEVCLLGSLESSGSDVYKNDLRLFINDLDFKLLNSITVSPEAGMGHFDNFPDAVKYCKRFSEIFQNAGNPTIHLKSGIHTVNLEVDNSTKTYAVWNAQSSAVKNAELYDNLAELGLVIDFPVSICGEGDSTELKIRHIYTFSDVTYTIRGQISILGDGFTDFTFPVDKFNSGTISFNNLKMNNCRITMPDLRITDGIDNFYFNVVFNSLTFDMTNFNSNPYDINFGPYCINLSEENDITYNKGNILIKNCIFAATPSSISKALIEVPEPSRCKNIIITDNLIFGPNSDSKIRLLNKDILNFDSAPGGSGIYLSGNISGTNFITSGTGSPKMVLDVAGWGDRVDRDLNIGGDLEVIGDGYFGENVDVIGNLDVSLNTTSLGFKYSTELSRYKYVFMDQISEPSLGQSNGTSFDTLTVNGRTWKTILFGDNTSDSCKLRIEVNPGETLDTVSIIFGTEDASNSIFSGYDFRILSEDAYGDQTVELVYTSMGTVTGGLGSSFEAAAQSVDGLEFDGENNKHYILQFRRGAASGYEQHLLYVQYKLKTLTVQSIGGLY